MKIKTNANGQVDFLLITGKDKSKGTMLASEALSLVHGGEVEKKGNEIVVNGKFIFAVEEDGAEPKAEPKYEPKEEVKEEVEEVQEETPEEETEEPAEETKKRIVRRKNG